MNSIIRIPRFAPQGLYIRNILVQPLGKRPQQLTPVRVPENEGHGRAPFYARPFLDPGPSSLRGGMLLSARKARLERKFRTRISLSVAEATHRTGQKLPARLRAVLCSMETRELLRGAMREVAAVAQAQGAVLPHDSVEQAYAWLERMPPTAMGNMQGILKGRATELETEVGVIVRLG